MKTIYLNKDQGSSLDLEMFPSAGPRPSVKEGIFKLYKRRYRRF